MFFLVWPKVLSISQTFEEEKFSYLPQNSKTNTTLTNKAKPKYLIYRSICSLQPFGEILQLLVVCILQMTFSIMLIQTGYNLSWSLKIINTYIKHMTMKSFVCNNWKLHNSCLFQICPLKSAYLNFAFKSDLKLYLVYLHSQFHVSLCWPVCHAIEQPLSWLFIDSSGRADWAVTEIQNLSLHTDHCTLNTLHWSLHDDHCTVITVQWIL